MWGYKYGSKDMEMQIRGQPVRFARGSTRPWTIHVPGAILSLPLLAILTNSIPSNVGTFIALT